MFVYFELFPGTLNIQPFVGPNMNSSKIRQVVKPLIDQLNSENIPHDMVVKDFPTFFELYIDLFADEGAGANMITGGRLFTKRDISANADDCRRNAAVSGSGPGRNYRTHRRPRVWGTSRG
jgi:hypothetical protein